MPIRISQETTERKEIESITSIPVPAWGQRIYFKNQFKKRRREKEMERLK